MVGARTIAPRSLGCLFSLFWVATFEGPQKTQSVRRSMPWAFWERESQVLPKGDLREEEERVSQEGCGEGRVILHCSMFPMSAAGARLVSLPGSARLRAAWEPAS